MRWLFESWIRTDDTWIEDFFSSLVLLSRKTSYDCSVVSAFELMGVLCAVDVMSRGIASDRRGGIVS